MKILLAPDKMKGSITAEAICDVIASTILSHDENIDVISCPLADGGDGTIDAIKNYRELKDVFLSVKDPLGRIVKAYYSVDQKAAYVELPIASGLVLLENKERNPLLTSTYGTGQLVQHAIDGGYKTIYLLLGGSSTNDCGIGILSALGYSFLDYEGKELEPIGKNLINIQIIDDSKVIKSPDVSLKILCDVTNPLYGPEGAAHIFARQKGADDKAIKLLEEGMIHFANLIQSYNGKSISDLKGGGAAGGIAAGLVGLCDATLQEGFETVAEIADLYKKIKSSDIVISGEGRLDDSSFSGKVIGGVYEICNKLNKHLSLFVGQNTCSDSVLEGKDLDILTIDSYATNTEDAMSNTNLYIQQMTRDFIKNRIS